MDKPKNPHFRPPIKGAFVLPQHQNPEIGSRKGTIAQASMKDRPELRLRKFSWEKNDGPDRDEG